jgi:aspartate/methionine/tyrosine aminotransferase
MSRRADLVPPFHAMAMSRRAGRLAAEGRSIVHLEVGQPATGAPRLAIDAVRDALDDPLGYTDADGLGALRRRIARHYRERHDVDLAADRVLVVAGASAGFTLAFLTSFDAGARVGIVEPGYPCYRNTLLALDMQPVPIAVGPATRWAPTPELLDAAGPLDGLVIASPSNPTGTVLDDTRLASIVAWARDRGVQLVVDEIYHGLTYEAPAPTVLEHTDDAIVVNSFSKYFSMTGWRIGWMVLPAAAYDAAVRLQQNLYICAPHVAQVAATAAMDARAELDGHVERYARNRRLLLDGLAAAGIDQVAAADGAFYVYADVSHLTTDTGIDSIALCDRWLDELGVATTPGIDFDLARGDRFVRFSYAGDTDSIGRACELLGGWRP